MHRLLFGVARSGLCRLRRFAVFDSALVAEVTTFLRLTLAFGGLTVFVKFFLNESRTLFDFAFHAHAGLLFNVCHGYPCS